MKNHFNIDLGNKAAGFKYLLLDIMIFMKRLISRSITEPKPMPWIFSGMLVLTMMSLSAQSNDWLWAKGLGGQGWYGCYGSAVEVSINGNVYTAGYFSGIIDFDPGEGVYELYSNGPDAMYISKLDNAGNFVWAKSIGAIDEDQVFGFEVYLQIDQNENIYISGVYFVDSLDVDPGPESYFLSVSESGSTLVLKLNSEGNFIWARAFGLGTLGSTIPTSMVINSDHIYVSGFFSGTTDFDPGNDTFNLISEGGWDIFITKLDSQGDFIWAQSMGGLSNERSGSIALDAEENIYITGEFEGTADFDPGLDLFELSSQGAIDIFIVKLDMDGGFQFAKSTGGTSWDSGNCIAVDTNGRGYFYITGFYTGTVDFDPGTDIYSLTSTGSYDIYISKLDLDGNFVWARGMGGSSAESGLSIAVSLDGQYVYTVGYFSETVDFNPGVGIYYLTCNGLHNTFISKLSASGDFAWADAAGGESFDYTNDITLDHQGGGYITGFVQSNQIQFGNTTIFNYANSTSFVCKFGICQGVVTSLNDTGHGSLRETISCVATGSIITFDLPPMSQIVLTSGEILIDKHLKLIGPGAMDLSISGNNSSRIFNLLAGINFEIRNLSLLNASYPTNGGAIYTKGYLRLTNVLLQHNFEGNTRKGLTLIAPGRITVEENVQIKP